MTHDQASELRNILDNENVKAAIGRTGRPSDPIESAPHHVTVYSEDDANYAQERADLEMGLATTVTKFGNAWLIKTREHN